MREPCLKEPAESGASRPSFFFIPAAIIAAAGFAVLIPMFFLGNPSGHDFEFHLDSWMEVLNQWKQGIVYPRWAAMAHFNYGEARFLFYPPFSWALGAALGAILPWAWVPGAFIWLVLFAAGACMFLLAREWLPRRDAIFAAAFYAVNPYHLVIVYWRSAFAELLASALLPLLLLFVLRTEDKGRKMIVPLALVVAAAWLTNAPSAVMVNYSLALLVVMAAAAQRSARILLYGAAAVVLGAGLASFYLLPAALEEKWVNIAQVLSPGVRPQDNFLFTTMNDVDHNRFNLLVSMVAVTEMVALAGAALLGWKRKSPGGLWWKLMVWAGVAGVLMSSVTAVLWEHLPKLRFVQLSWRWLLCFNLALALLVTIGFRKWLTRAMVCAVMLAVVAGVWFKVQPPWWDSAADIAEIGDNLQEGKGYEGTDEYVPTGADSYEIKQDAPQVGLEPSSPGRIHVERWAPEDKLFTAETKRPTQLVLRLFNYPAWQVAVNGVAVKTETHEVTGQMVVPVERGTNRVRVKLVRTWDRSWGMVISAVAAVLMLLLWGLERRRATAA